MSASPSIVVIKVVRISRLASSRKCEIESKESERGASFCDCDKRVGGATNDGENEYTQNGLYGTDYKEMLRLCFRFLCWYVCLQNDIKFSMFAHMKHTTCTQNPTERLSFGCEIRLLIVLDASLS